MGDYNKKILAVIDLKKSYVTKGNTYPVLKGVSMEMNRGEFVEAADEFLKWNKAGGIVYRGLTRRRTVERKLFLEP